MGFDTLRTVKADTKDTVLEGTLIRYGDSAAQIAFATGESPTCSRDSRRHLLNAIRNPLASQLLVMGYSYDLNDI